MQKAVCFAAFLTLCIGACATPGRVKIQFAPKQALQGPMEVAILGNRTDVERSLEDSLRARGFRVKRFPSTVTVTTLTTPTGAETYARGAVRYVLEVDWETVDRCFGGGFRFRFIAVEVIDLKENETVMSMRSGGYSEKCQPLSGHIFGGIAQQLAEAWTREPAQDTSPN